MASDPIRPERESPVRGTPERDEPAGDPPGSAHGAVTETVQALRSWFEERRSTICACGHPYEAHQHYRRGSDCAFCDCEHWHHG